MRIQLMSCLVIISVLCGCSSKMERIEIPVSKEVAATKGLVTVVVTRPPTPLMRIGFEVYDGDKKIGRLYQNSEIVWKRKPGYLKLRFVPAITGWVKFASVTFENYESAIMGETTWGHPYILYGLTYEGYLGSGNTYHFDCGINKDDGRTIWIRPEHKHSSAEMNALMAHIEKNQSKWEKLARARGIEMLDKGSKGWDIPLNWFIGDQQKVVTLVEGMTLLEVHDLIVFERRTAGLRLAVLDFNPVEIAQSVRDSVSEMCVNRGNVQIDSPDLKFGVDGKIVTRRLYGKFIFNNEPCQLENVKESIYKIQPIPW